MSSQKRTAFARVPRNQGTSTTGANAPARARVQINAAWIRRLHQSASVDTDLSTVMTKVGGNLNIQVQPNGAVFPTLQNTAGEVLADMQDIVRIQTMNSSLTSERKEAQKIDAGTTLQHVVASVIQTAKEKGEALARMNSKFLEVYRSVNTQMRTLVTNVAGLETIEVEDHSPQSIVKKVLMEMAARTRVATGEFLLARARATEDDTPVKLNAFLRKHNVSMYIFGRLTGSQINFRQTGFDINTVLFPSDPSKGFYLTWREINSDIINSLGGALQGADLVLKFAQDHSLIRKLINVAEGTNLTDFETTNSFASKIAGTPFLVPPFDGAVSPSSIFRFLAKNGSRGVQFQSGNVFSPQDNLKFIGTLGKRLAYMLLQRPAFKADVYAGVFPGFTYDVLVADKKDLFVQLQEWSKNQSSADLAKHYENLTVASSFSYSDATKSVVLDLLGITRTSANGRAVLATLGAPNIGLPVSPGKNTEEFDYFTEIKNRAVTLKDTRADLTEIIRDKFKGLETTKSSSKRDREDRAQKRFGKSALTERTALSKQAEVVIAAVKSAGYRTLAIRLGPWFRQFLTVEIQNAVASIFMARLEAFLAEPLQLTREEKIGFLDPDDFGNNEDDDGSFHDHDNDGDNPLVENPDNA